MSPDTKRLASIVLLGLLVRLVVAVALGGGFHFADETKYVDAARGRLHGGSFDPAYERAVLLAGMILVFALGHALFVGRMRYRITVLPLVFVLAGAGLATLQAASAGRLGRSRPDPATG